MKKHHPTPSFTTSVKKITLFALTLFCFSSIRVIAQPTYSYDYSIAKILAAGTTGITLPDGTVATATKIVTSTGQYGTVAPDIHGSSGPDFGGTFTGVALPAYTGITDPSQFTEFVMNPSTSVDNGIATNFASAVGFHVHFSRPVYYAQCLMVDIDGTVTTTGSNGNSEWATAFCYNGNTFVPMTGTYFTGTSPAPEITANTATIAAGHAWNTMKNAEIPGADNLPATYTVYRQNATNDGDGSPDDIQNQVMFNTTSLVTDFFIMTGIYKVAPGPNVQRSGCSPIIANVAADFGDAPDSYGTLLSSNGASHGVFANIKLGSIENSEADGLPSASASNSNDDDGVAVVNPVLNNGTSTQTIATYSLTTSYTNNTAAVANVIAWIDWNNDGIFETGEAQSATVAAGTTGNVTFTWNNFTLSGMAGKAQTYARIRITTANMTAANPTGPFPDGEVEDYSIPFSIVLPLQLTSFSGTSVNGNAQLNWRAENQADKNNFEIERSTDGMNFTEIGQRPAIATVADYNYVDDSVNNNTVFYRLKITGTEGQFFYSKIIELHFGNNTTINISPNPVQNAVIIDMDVAEKLQLRIISALGSTVIAQDLPAQKHFVVDVNNLAKGLFILQLSNENGEVITSKKMIKE